MTIIEIDSIVDEKRRIIPDFIKKNGYKSYIWFCPFYGDELERLSICSGYESGERITLTFKEGRKPQESIHVFSIDDAWDALDRFSYKETLAEIFPEKLFVWKNQDNDYFVVFGNEDILKKCVSMKDMKADYRVSLEGADVTEKDFIRWANRMYNTLAGTQMEDPEV